MLTAWQAHLPLERARRFVDWWAGELSEVLAARSPQRRPWRIMFLRRGKGCDVYVRSDARIEQVAAPDTGSDRLLAELTRRFGARKGAGAPVVLRLQPSEVVETRISVPAAAREVMEPILRNQIERLAPWPVEKALFAYEVAGEAGEAGTLDVALTVTGRNVVEGLVAELEGLGYAPDIVDCGTDPAAEPRMNLLPRQGAEADRPGRLAVSVVGIALLLSLAIAAIGTGALAWKTSQLDGINAQLEALGAKSKADGRAESDARRQRRQALLAAEKRAQPAMSVMLEALSRALPDSAWLDRLEASQGSVTFAGKAANAAALIGPIEASRHFTDVQFSAPTTRAEGETLESFTITARIVAGKELN
jgi:general secretion pathway protein L